jgi:hypothetical protein
MLVRMCNPSRKVLQLNSPESVSSSRVSRRDFIRTTSLAAGAFAFGVPTLLRGQNLNSKLNIASIGAMGGKAGATPMPARVKTSSRSATWIRAQKVTRRR